MKIISEREKPRDNTMPAKTPQMGKTGVFIRKAFVIQCLILKDFTEAYL